MNRLLKTIAAMAVGCAGALAMAQVPPVPASPAATARPVPIAAAPTTAPGAQADTSHALTTADLATFFDGLVPFALERGDVAGGVISVVKDGQVIFARGYGVADLKTRATPSPATTLFRPGSVSKLFTWTAVMQQVEAGKLDLDRDINEYLDFRIPPRDGKPITLRNLLTHTPGFEDTAKGLFPAKPEDVNLERYLKSHAPARIFALGEIVAYSNYGCGLAGYIVQRVSGEPFAEYVQRHIFAPLGMAHSTFAQPLPPALAPLMATGYKSVSDGKPIPFELVDPAPAGAMSSTALDMANFMIAQLQDGRFGDTRILQQATAELMHSPQHTAAPGLNGFDLGFYQESSNGQRIIGHAGDTTAFHSDLHLLTDANVGVFMSFNSGGNEGGAHVIRKALFRAFLDRYFPHDVPAQPVIASASTDAARAAGWYQSSRRNDSALRGLYLLGQVSVAPQTDGTIAVSALKNYAGTPLRWQEVGPLQYRQVNGNAQLKFVTDAQGDIRYWATDAEVPVFVFQRVPGFKALGLVGPMVLVSAAIILATLLVWGVGAWVRRHYRKALLLTPRQRRWRLGSRLGTLVLAVVIAGWLALLVAVSASDALLLHGTITPWLFVMYALGVLGLVGAVAVVINMLQTWRAPVRGRWVRAGEILLALAAVYLAWFIVAFGLISFSASY